jgi:SepF-like predicted cell division protein (DUF552 family)
MGFRDLFGRNEEEDYVEIDVGSTKSDENKISVKPFVLKSFEGVDDILNSLREGYTIAVIDIKQLKSKDIIELKRAISKIKKTTDALEGSIAGFGENTIIATPQFAEIYKPIERKKKEATDFIGG